MATTKNHIIYDILNVGRGGKISDDENISTKQVSFWIDNTRSLLIRRDLDKKRTINSNLIQTIPCMSVSLIDASLCPCVVSGCTILRTDKRVPQAIELSNKNLITSISPIIIGSTPFSLISIDRVPYAMEHPLTNKLSKAFIHDNYVYLIGNDISLLTITNISVSGVFESPGDLSNFTSCTGGVVCYSDDDIYPIANWMIEPLKETIFRNNLQLTIQSLTDKSGNAKGDVEPIQHN